VITDVFENGRGIPAIGEMCRECVGVRVVMLTGCRDQEWERAAMVAGAHALFVNDSPIEVLLRAIRAQNPEFDLLQYPPLQIGCGRPKNSPRRRLRR